MAHELEIIDGKAQAFFGGNRPAWHGLGTVIEGDATTEEALTLAGLGDPIVKVPLVIHLPSGETVEVPNKFMTVRDPEGANEKYLGTVGTKYQVFDNRQAFAFGDALVGSHGAHWHTAGSLHEGTKAWMLLKLPQDVFIAGEESEQVQPFVCFQNSHDGSSSIKVFTTFVRVVCQNTLTMALQGTQRMFTLRHTGNFSDPEAMQNYVMQAQETVGVVFDLLAQMEREGAAMMQETFSDRRFDTMLKRILPTPKADYTSEKARASAEGLMARKRDLLFDYFKDSPNLENVRGTKWAALQAVIEVNDHRHAERASINDPLEKRFDRIVNGAGIVQDAYDYLAA